ncbi:hypothetical protein [Xenorhabdus beddingii]|uniref:hypothetical protein n=1 Tax=Xenorhabdus beddingii TaxID=40578 RepID=UPI000A320BCB|nr:hypothetical protein [Xenorhabdus beddingii]
MRNNKIKCAKLACKHIHYENERIIVPDPDYPEFEMVNTTVCPKCGADRFYRIEELRENND